VQNDVNTSRPCPVCGLVLSEVLYRQRFANFTKGSIGDGYDVVACSSCGTCFATGLPDERRFAEYYADSSKYDLSARGASLLTSDVERYASQAEFVAAHVADKGSPILDVGTATGGFLQALRVAGFERPYGVDPSPDAVRVARDDLALDVVVGGLDAAEVWGHKFGVISYVAVFEHVLDPREQARSVSRFLLPGGHVFISVPDASAFPDHVGAPFQEFSVEHINYFTAASLANVMGTEGYSLVADRSIVLPLGTDGHGPALEAVYRWEGAVRRVQLDSAGADAVREYIRGCQRTEDGIAERIATLASTGERIYVWGTGTHTLHLLETTRLDECRIEAFLDSNPHYAGGTLAGRRVLAPQDLPAANAPILVSSAVSQSGIAQAARDRFGADVPLILLY
jgi:2-polyprenyl-3-methyl-5-hydroxy-6-metoxy-1,4-benzoquinol methylase